MPAYTPPQAWSDEWMEQHPNPEFRETLQNLLISDYNWEEARVALDRGSGYVVWPAGAAPNPIPFQRPPSPASAPAPAHQASGQEAGSKQAGEKRQRPLLARLVSLIITVLPFGLTQNAVTCKLKETGEACWMHICIPCHWYLQLEIAPAEFVSTNTGGPLPLSSSLQRSPSKSTGRRS